MRVRPDSLIAGLTLLFKAGGKKSLVNRRKAACIFQLEVNSLLGIMGINHDKGGTGFQNTQGGNQGVEAPGKEDGDNSAWQEAPLLQKGCDGLACPVQFAIAYRLSFKDEGGLVRCSPSVSPDGVQEVMHMKALSVSGR